MTLLTETSRPLYWLEGDLYFASLGEFGALAWGYGFPLRHVPHVPRSASHKVRTNACQAIFMWPKAIGLAASPEPKSPAKAQSLETSSGKMCP